MNARSLSIPPAAPGQSVWLQAGTLLDGSGGPPQHEVNLVYDSNAIRFVGVGGRTPPPAMLRFGQTVPDAVVPDGTLLPGLTDAHAHLFLEGGELDATKRAATLRRSPEELLAGARERLKKLVRLGVVAVRDAGDRDGVGLALSRLYRSEARPLMPYVESPGAAIHHRGRYGSFMSGALEDYATAADCVAARVQAGADRIKLIATGIIDFKQARVTSAPQMTTAEIAQLVAAAKSSGRQTFAHASGDDGIANVIDGGVDSIEHGFFVRDDQLARMRDLNRAWVPTFAPVQAQIDHAEVMGWSPAIVANLQKILERHGEALVRAHALGITIVAGSDAGSYGVPHGLGLLREMELMERAGLPAGAVIHSATGAGAHRLGYREKFGCLREGWPSRFILTRHSPLETVANLRRPRVVVFDNAVFETGDAADPVGL